MEPITATLTATALTEGVKFLYAQAGEMIKGWRERRSNPDATGPRLVDPPKAVTVTPSRDPVVDPPDSAAEDTLANLKDAVERIKDGVVPVDAPESRRAMGLLRDYLEQLTGASITFEGEKPRTLEASDIRVEGERVRGNVRGVVAALDGLQATIKGVTVQGKDVDGDVEGVRLT